MDIPCVLMRQIVAMRDKGEFGDTFKDYDLVCFLKQAFEKMDAFDEKVTTAINIEYGDISVTWVSPLGSIKFFLCVSGIQFAWVGGVADECSRLRRVEDLTPEGLADLLIDTFRPQSIQVHHSLPQVYDTLKVMLHLTTVGYHLDWEGNTDTKSVVGSYCRDFTGTLEPSARVLNRIVDFIEGLA